MNNNQTEVDHKNSTFWDELCGSQLAKELGIHDFSPESLKKFDDLYFGFYPYLLSFVGMNQLKDLDVLEVGLGYGSLSQKILEAGVNYTGLDIAEGPVGIVNERVVHTGGTGIAHCGSIFESGFTDNKFDRVIAIGCFHHTGNTQKAILTKLIGC